MKRFYTSMIIAGIMLCLSVKTALADSVIMQDGQVVKGKITFVIGNLFEINTNDGIKRFTRSVSSLSAADVVKVGFIHKKLVSGQITYYDANKLVLNQNGATLTIPAVKVRELTLIERNSK